MNPLSISSIDTIVYLCIYNGMVSLRTDDINDDYIWFFDINMEGLYRVDDIPIEFDSDINKKLLITGVDEL